MGNGKEIGGKALSVAPAERRASTEEWADGGKGKGKYKAALDPYAAQQQYQQAMMQFWMMQQAAYMQQFQMWGGAATGGAAGSGDLEYEGSLKSIKSGHGFIVCAETFKLYNRDVYIDKDILPVNAQVYDRIKFKVTLNEKGHPRAASASLAKF